MIQRAIMIGIKKNPYRSTCSLTKKDFSQAVQMKMDELGDQSKLFLSQAP